MRVLLADDHEMVRDTIAAYLRSEGQAVVTCVPDFTAAARAIGADQPYDLILLDFTMPGMNGLDGLKRAIELSGDTPVALISGTAPTRIAMEAVEMGAAGFIPKTLGAKSLVNAVRFMIMGETFVPASALAEGEEENETEFVRQLSQREREVLLGLCLGKANKEIARELDLQEVTVKLHVRTLCRKIGAKNRTQAAVIAKEAGFA
ncbi:response regulator transcription factor [Paracoccus sp. 1_MG-2023]|uniref:response regulator transcription factor n=1 Tax=unclassified Paracoccus (in: a-proteobacteria) TaxID=2688777 RepID=UPI001C09B54D|nr:MULTISPECIES: response regulator transcription factor [unclassified Paracoccus (in: a-proteobacteria)]MBU2956079.1 response regulator transcription factor [Paracoccus sp. C2R09]MDO6669485.1 response regulator transcription factor [Paracoccus sp. 1_MG-2023]